MKKVAEVGQAAPGACTDIDENTMYSSRAGSKYICHCICCLINQSADQFVCAPISRDEPVNQF